MLLCLDVSPHLHVRQVHYNVLIFSLVEQDILHCSKILLSMQAPCPTLVAGSQLPALLYRCVLTQTSCRAPKCQNRSSFSRLYNEFNKLCHTALRCSIGHWLGSDLDETTADELGTVMSLAFPAAATRVKKLCHTQVQVAISAIHK